MLVYFAMNVLISADDIQDRVRSLAKEIERDHTEGVHLVCVLKGAFIFLGDLMRAIEIPLGIEFIAISSYGAEMRTSGEVRILKDLDVAIEGRHILVVEDIVDTGMSLHSLLQHLPYREGFRRIGADLVCRTTELCQEVPHHLLVLERVNTGIPAVGIEEAFRDLSAPDRSSK